MVGLTLAQVIAARADSLSDALKKDYQKHVLGVRYPIHAGDQEFDAAGNPLNPGPAPEWEVYGGIYVEKLSLSRDTMKIEGPRVARGDLSTNDKPGAFKLSKSDRFIIHLDRPISSMDDARAVLDRVFYLDQNDRAHLRPEYRRPDSSASPAVNLMYMRGKPEYILPKPQYTPEPQFTDEARRQRVQGTVMMSILVDQAGTVSRLRIERAAGYGLDESSVETVKKWRFTPGLRNGQPVSVEMNVETSFHLY